MHISRSQPRHSRRRPSRERHRLIAMPRPRVQPRNRKRVIQACSTCRYSKKRCSGTAPCSECQKRGLSTTCVLPFHPQRSQKSRNAGQHSLQEPGSVSHFAAPKAFSSAMPNSDRGEPQASSHGIWNAMDPATASSYSTTTRLNKPPPSAFPKPSKRKGRMLLNARGERGEWVELCEVITSY